MRIISGLIYPTSGKVRIQGKELGIAAAIMEKPEILILDEPLNALDTNGVELFIAFKVFLASDVVSQKHKFFYILKVETM